MSVMEKFVRIWKHCITGKGLSDEELEILKKACYVPEERSEHSQIVEDILASINETERGMKGPRKADYEHKRIIANLLDKGRESLTRAHYKDGIQAKTLSYNGELMTYDLSKGQLPLITLRPIATRLAFNEILWIYQDASNDLNLLRDKYGVTWWDEWDIGDRTIGMAYGAVVKKYDLMHRLLDGLQKDPDGRRHIMSLWQDEVFTSDAKYGLPPCCFMTMWNVRHEYDGDYLDMTLVQR